MAYILVEDFRGGLDARRMNQTATPGSLVEMKNCHVTRGGEIEKRPAFVELCDLPTDTNGSKTFGLAAANGQIYVFGSASPTSVSFPLGSPPNLNYVQLVHPSGEELTDVLSVDFYNGQHYVAAQFADGRIYHYFNGTRITDWFDGRARVSFYISGGSAGGTKAHADLIVTGGTSNASDILRVLRINNVDLISSAVSHTGNNASTVTAITAAINAGTSTHGYTAQANGGVVDFVKIDAPVGGTAYNGYQLTAEVEGAFTVTTVDMSGGVDNAITNITVDGISIINNPITWETSHSYTASKVAAEINASVSAPDYEATSVNAYVNIIAKESGSSYNGLVAAVTKTANLTWSWATTGNNADELDGGHTDSTATTYTPGEFARPIKTKMYALNNSLLHFSKIDDPTEWNDTSAGAGFINLTNHAKGSEDLKAIANYFDNIAVFAEQSVQIWFVDPDETKNQQIQVLINTGTIAPRSVVEFGDNDVFYLSNSGLRSLRSRDSSNAAFVGDIGNPIDDLITADIRSSRASAEKAQAILEPRDGRYMIAVGSKIYVFSFFPSSKVSAWSVYEPGFTVEQWAYDGRQILCRSADKLYSLGGENGNTYDTSEVVVQMPYLDASAPATFKNFHSIDVTCENTWTVSVATDPQDITLRETVATVDQTTFGEGRVAISNYSTHIAPRLVCNSAGAAKLGNIAIHYDSGEAG